MPRRAQRGDGSVYFHAASGRWTGVLSISPHPVTGKPRRRYVYAASEKEAERELRKLVRDRDDGKLAEDPTLTVAGWLDHWLNVIAKPTLKARTWDSYESKIRVHVVPRIGRVKLERLRPEDLERLYAAMDAGDPARGVQPASAASVLQVHRILSRAIKVAHQRGKIPRHVAQLVDAPKVRTKRRPAPFDVAQARAILTAAAARRNPARWMLALSSGLRQGEALAVAWDQVDLNAGTLAVTRELLRLRSRHGCGQPVPTPYTRGDDAHAVRDVYPCGKRQAARCPARDGESGLFLDTPKSAAGERILPLPPAVVDALRRHRKTQLEERLQDGPLWRGWRTRDVDGTVRDIDLVFAQRNGRPIEPRADWEEWGRILDAAGVPRTRLHDARHTTGSLLKRQGAALTAAMDYMGHSQVSMTAHYQQGGSDLLEALALGINDVLWGDQKPGPGATGASGRR